MTKDDEFNADAEIAHNAGIVRLKVEALQAVEIAHRAKIVHRAELRSYAEQIARDAVNSTQKLRTGQKR